MIIKGIILLGLTIGVVWTVIAWIITKYKQ